MTEGRGRREGGREGGSEGGGGASQRKYLRGFFSKCQHTPSSHIKEGGNYGCEGKQWPRRERHRRGGNEISFFFLLHAKVRCQGQRLYVKVMQAGALNCSNPELRLLRDRLMARRVSVAVHVKKLKEL